MSNPFSHDQKLTHSGKSCQTHTVHKRFRGDACGCNIFVVPNSGRSDLPELAVDELLWPDERMDRGRKI